ncbi:MAG: DMT family transporter [Proteobacteria bacterium]|nr:DMT family transporter [Pseudomonadota bacterium]
MSEAPAATGRNIAGRNLALGALAIALIGFALTPNFVRLSEIGPLATGFWRALFAAPLLVTLLAVTIARREVPAVRVRPRDYAWLIFTSCAMAGDLILFQSAVHHTSIANASLIGSLFPIVATLGAWLLFDERITRTFIIGLGVALSGAALLVYAGGTPLEPIALGDYLAAATALSFAFYVLGLKQLRGRFTTSTVMTWNLGISACILLPLAIAMGENLLPPTLTGWAILIAFAVVVDVIGRGSYTFSFAQLTASFIAVGMLLVPGVAALIAWVLFDEALSALQGIAVITAMIGIGLAQYSQR